MREINSENKESEQDLGGFRNEIQTMIENNEEGTDDYSFEFDNIKVEDLGLNEMEMLEAYRAIDLCSSNIDFEKSIHDYTDKSKASETHEKHMVDGKKSRSAFRSIFHTRASYLLAKHINDGPRIEK